MKVFLTGGTGAIGRPLVARLLESGHDVVATTRSPEHAAGLREQGVEAVVVDLLDRQAVLDAVRRARPEAVLHQATSLSGRFDLKHFGRFFEQTNRLRTTGTDVLLEAARAAGANRFVAQGYAGWPYRSDGPVLKTEEEPFEQGLPEEMRTTVAAIAHLERAVLGAEGLEGIVLRYGSFYGPGTSLGSGGDIVQAVRRRSMPVVGDGAGVWSFLHVEDGADATVAALERGNSGAFNVVDDEPVTTATFLPELARILGAKPPRHVPAWLAKPLIGEPGLWLMTKVRGVSNEKAKRELGWTPGRATWRVGFRELFHGGEAAAAG